MASHETNRLIIMYEFGLNLDSKILQFHNIKHWIVRQSFLVFLTESTLKKISICKGFPYFISTFMRKHTLGLKLVTAPPTLTNDSSKASFIVKDTRFRHQQAWKLRYFEIIWSSFVWKSTPGKLSYLMNKQQTVYLRRN